MRSGLRFAGGEVEVIFEIKTRLAAFAEEKTSTGSEDERDAASMPLPSLESA